ncbi:MAG: ornithine cyclodeaminase family protein, partial [Alphaproteobacteria bacterium]|nr:ornithine cyclodeaminase family protein [Alphaproteobacteria bacterium]
SRLLMVGAGALAPHLVRGHRAVRPLRAVSIWNRRPEKAAALAMSLRGEGIAADAVTDLEPAARAADIISCATPSRTPLIKGAWIKPGTHLDLVGGFTPEMREADDDVVRRARLYVDTRAGAAAEAGDIVEPVSRGVIPKDAVLGDLFDLCGGRVAGRESGTEITVFKSCGTAIEDLAAAELVLEQS